MLSNSLEEYLKTMYILKNTQNQIRVTDISKRLGYSKPSVNRAINCLKEEKLITYETYGNIELTEDGEKTAKAIIKRYDILRLFLVEVLGVDEETAQKEAEKMKHCISENTITKLENYIIKILKIEDLKCNYNLASSRCQNCVRITSKLKQEKGDKNE